MGKPKAMPNRSLLLIPVLAGILIFAGLRGLERATVPPPTDGMPPPATAPVTGDGQPRVLGGVQADAYAEGVDTLIFAADGELDYRLQAASQTHYPTGLSVFARPLIRLRGAGQSYWVIAAATGTVRTTPAGRYNAAHAQRILLFGDVTMETTDEFGKRTRLASEDLTIDPQADTIATDSAVVMESDRIRQTATGLRGDIARNRMVLLSSPRGNLTSAHP